MEHRQTTALSPKQDRPKGASRSFPTLELEVDANIEAVSGSGAAKLPSRPTDRLPAARTETVQRAPETRTDEVAPPLDRSTWLELLIFTVWIGEDGRRHLRVSIGKVFISLVLLGTAVGTGVLQRVAVAVWMAVKSVLGLG
jgi:hypothetical protein